MKTLTDFKRALQVGSVWYRKHVYEDNFTKRIVTRIHSTHVYFQDDSGKEVRLDFPKTSEFDVKMNGEVEIYRPATYTYKGVERVEIPKQLILTYKSA